VRQKDNQTNTNNIHATTGPVNVANKSITQVQKTSILSVLYYQYNLYVNYIYVST